MQRLPFLLCALASAAGPARADAPPPAVATYALVVGSNAAGPGQTDLRYAEEDARRVGAFLTELGGYRAEGVDVVVHPTPDVLRARLARLAARVQADIAAGKQARVFFYYSGHARATAIDLGKDALPLSELRERLFAVPATLTVVVLDACQSGAFSRPKGATSVADFSFNSRQQLDARGVAVLASSSGSELSQESEQLRSSYFTHHLLVGMRGAGDANGDGQVSVDEAYRYAYHQTLLATATTAVGGQHVSLEVDLKGHGEVPLSFPRAATSAIVLPAALEGHALVQDKKAKAVVAETHKAKGAATRIAVAPGEYEVLVRQGGKLMRCQVSGGGTVELDRCTSEKLVAAGAKGGELGRTTRFEVTAFAGAERRDDYLQRLDDFGYREEGVSSGIALGAARRIAPRLWVGGQLALQGSPKYVRDTELEPQRFRWASNTVLAIARGEQPFAEHGFFRRLGVYAQVGAGLTIDRTRFDEAMGDARTETFVGPALAVGAGLRLDSAWLSGVTLSAGYQFLYAPAITNLLDEKHGGGGNRVGIGISFSY
ncbi:MAG: caspase family protein [Deltaproteobacteria bacterium]|nr:caspase family protein [Deltaproteobacteria bacterium]